MSQTGVMGSGGRALVAAGVCLGGLAGGFLLVLRGAVTVDLGLGRRSRPLGPLRAEITATPEVVFDVVAVVFIASVLMEVGVAVATVPVAACPSGP